MGADLGIQLRQIFDLLLLPGRRLLETTGQHPLDIQVWALLVALFMLAVAAPATYGDWVLTRRQRRTTGTVIGIDRDGDGVSTPRIGFRDERGRPHEFASPLPTNVVTANVGNPVGIVYDPLHPERAREAGRPILKALSALGWYGVALLALAYAFAGGGLPLGT